MWFLTKKKNFNLKRNYFVGTLITLPKWQFSSNLIPFSIYYNFKAHHNYVTLCYSIYFPPTRVLQLNSLSVQSKIIHLKLSNQFSPRSHNNSIFSNTSNPISMATDATAKFHKAHFCLIPQPPHFHPKLTVSTSWPCSGSTPLSPICKLFGHAWLSHCSSEPVGERERERERERGIGLEERLKIRRQNGSKRGWFWCVTSERRRKMKE